MNLLKVFSTTVLPFLLINFYGTHQQYPTPFGEHSLIVVDGLNLNISCGFEECLGPVKWVINGTMFDLSTDVYPCFVRDSQYCSICIERVKLCLNDTTFQCISSKVHHPGRITRLIIQEAPLPKISNDYKCDKFDGTLDCDNIQVNQIKIDTKTLVIGKDNFTTFDILSPQRCGPNLYLHVNNHINLTIIEFNISLSSLYVNISSSTILSNNDEILELQIIGSADTQCASNHYTINNKATTEIILSGNQSICFLFPISTGICDTLRSTLYLALSSECIINLLYFDGNFDSIFGCKDWEINNYKVIVNSTFRYICLYDWNVNFSKTVVHFACITININELISYNLISSHEIVANSTLLPQPHVTDAVTSYKSKNVSENYTTFSSTVWPNSTAKSVASIVAITFLVIFFITSMFFALLAATFFKLIKHRYGHSRI